MTLLFSALQCGDIAFFYKCSLVSFCNETSNCPNIHDGQSLNFLRNLKIKVLSLYTSKSTDIIFTDTTQLFRNGFTYLWCSRISVFNVCWNSVSFNWCASFICCWDEIIYHKYRSPRTPLLGWALDLSARKCWFFDVCSVHVYHQWTERQNWFTTNVCVIYKGAGSFFFIFQRRTTSLDDWITFS